MLQIRKTKTGLIDLYLGAYFRGFIPTLSGLLFLILFISIIVIIAKDLISNPDDRFFTVGVMILLAGIFANLFMGYEGVEFDTEKKIYRRYKKRLGLKSGKWKDLKPYTLLCLSAQYNRTGRNPSSTSLGSSKNRSLEINLSSLTEKSILLAECKNYQDAESALNHLNDFLKLEIKNFVLEQYNKPQPRR